MATAKKWTYKLNSDQGKQMRIEVTAVVEVEATADGKRFVEGWLDAAPDCAADWEVRVVSMEAKEV